MSTTVLAAVSFDFKGKHYHIAERIDLRQFMEGRYTSIYAYLARAGEVGPYSYEHEVLHDQPIEFSEPDAPIAPFVSAQNLDFDAIAAWLQEENLLTQLQEIAKRCLGVDALEQQPELRQALVEAWRAGRASVG